VTNNSNPAGNPLITLPSKPEEAAQSLRHGNDEFARFQDTARKLVQVPKPKAAKRSTEPSGRSPRRK
jgi:hypothetical protein